MDLFHFKYIEVKTRRVTRALNRLMSNLRGPNEKLRRLFANIVMSVIMYGAPVWGMALGKSQLLANLIRLMRTVAQRVISAYRTVSGTAALLLARLPSLRYFASMRQRVYERIKTHRENTTYIYTYIIIHYLGKLEKRSERPSKNDYRMEGISRKAEYTGEYTKLAIMFETWLGRKFGSMTFHSGFDRTWMFW